MTHINHYQEITEELAVAIRKILNHGFTVRNQTVLLNHVNNYYKTLAETFRRMFWIGVHPYYLLQCHKEKGIVHFIVPVQIGKILIRHLQGWISGITMPRYAANIEGGGGKVLLMPSGHDTLNRGINLEEKISESYAMITTWDGKEIHRYESLGRAGIVEYQRAMKIMNKFIGRKGVFLPKVIIVDDEGNHIKTTNKERLPQFYKFTKSMLLNYKTEANRQPLTNPTDKFDELEKEFANSKYAGKPL